MPATNEDKDESYEESTYLIRYTRKLERDVGRLETEKQFLEGERIRLQREIHNLRAEIDRLRTPPLLVATLLEYIKEKDMAIIRSSAGPIFLVNVRKNLNRKGLVPGARVALNQRSLAIVDVLPSPKEPSIMAMEVEERPNVSYRDIGGLDEQIREIRESVELPLKNPHIFKEIGIEPPKGVLLHGPPGTGKTLLAKAVARETKATFIRLIGSELVQKFIGEGARLVREVFDFAREKAPSILFIDEIDSIGAKRLETATSGDREVQRTLMQLLSEMDGFEPRGNVKIIAATNRIDILDPALLRPGRFDRIIEIPLPDETGRYEIFKIHMKNMTLDEDVNIKKYVKLTENMTGADIKNICTEAGMFAIRNRRSKINDHDFIKAIDKIKRKSQNKILPRDISSHYI